jgi:hypothetical protein
MSLQKQSGNRPLLDVVQELLQTRAVTREHLLRLLSEQPALLGPDTQTLLNAIAQAQTNEAAKEQVLHLADLLARMSRDGVTPVMEQEMSRLREEAAGHRRRARLQADRANFRAWRHAASSPAEVDPRDLPSLAERLGYLKARAASERPLPHGRNLLASSRPESETPAFLYRGESGAFPKTQTSLTRARGSALSGKAIAELDKLSARIVAALRRKWSLSRDQALGFLQHYGFPTELLDATADPLVAASFASSLRVGDEGAFRIIPTQQLTARHELVDLRIGAFAKRPRIQSAFAIRCERLPNFKDPTIVRELKLEWLPFRLTHEDTARFEPRFELLDARSDELAGLIWLLLDHAAKFSDEAAAYLSQRLDPAPFFAVMGRDSKAAAIPEDLAVGDAPSQSDDAFRESHYERWSDRFAVVEPKPLPPELQKELLTAPEAGAVIRFLTPKGLGLSD